MSDGLPSNRCTSFVLILACSRSSFASDTGGELKLATTKARSITPAGSTTRLAVIIIRLKVFNGYGAENAHYHAVLLQSRDNHPSHFVAICVNRRKQVCCL